MRVLVDAVLRFFSRAPSPLDEAAFDARKRREENHELVAAAVAAQSDARHDTGFQKQQLDDVMRDLDRALQKHRGDPMKDDRIRDLKLVQLFQCSAPEKENNHGTSTQKLCEHCHPVVTPKLQSYGNDKQKD